MAKLDNNLLHAASWATFIECLIDGPHTAAELCAESGMAPWTVKKVLRVFKRRKRIYIAAWEPDGIGRPVMPAFMWGTKPDVPRPKPKTATQRSAALAARKRLARINLALGVPMKLYKTTSVDLDDKQFAEFASSADNASKIRTRLKKMEHGDIKTEEVDVPTTRTELIAFLNSLTASKATD